MVISNIRIGLFILAIIFVVLVFFYWRNEELYEEKKQRIRKTWYGLFITSVTVYFMIKGIDLTLWKNLLMFTAMVIFVDIAFILTPNISEIWGAKFSDIGKTVQSIKRSLIASKARGEIYTNIIQNINPAAFGTMEWHTEEEYTKSLNSFLDSYGEKIGAKIVVFEAANELNTGFRGIRSQFSITVPLEHIEQLNEQKAVQVENVGIIPAKIMNDVFIVIDGKKNSLQDRDFENVYNLTIHHSYFSK
ncbi:MULTISPECIES: type II toxin-antitoxin system SpoIISA family toxin [Bacillus cereus group]|uniref:Stage II sporulation protein SB n=1 Tax=Bacillus cereus TaxID=1396 RepID=A0A2A8TVE4_BACCE|nr:type II toxin-antitoxin system SpoIISA family toxin [Bacillus cereus]PDY75593.1 stage II sporulation protein SB [Bacillus cereus]PFA02277.1 stage II sporulation protein SB [Bacillus cereus]PFM34605.1 stage II sporulation protein SB [Bacillus cereus]PGL60740.1 stage II sporulation protein SB [Bacillus cereus]PGQ11461.1 stage II sporulation protein SB [Bacillus cereus]